MKDMNMNVGSLAEGLEDIAVDLRTLATNFTSAVPDALGVGADMKTRLIEDNKLYFWLLGTPLANQVRAQINSTERGMSTLVKDATSGKYKINVPGSYWSLPAQDTSQECCWQPFDFARCEASAPVNRLCLKDCDNIDDIIMGDVIGINKAYPPIAKKGEKFNSIKDRVALMSMGFLTVRNVIMGMDNVTTPTMKPFHGLAQVMANPAIATFDGTNVLAAFDYMWCRLRWLDLKNVVIAVNPIIYDSIMAAVQPGQNGKLPEGWTKNGETITFHGIGFIQDTNVPVDLAAANGDAWVLSGDTVGSWMRSDLLNPIRKPSNGALFAEQTLANGCGNECKFYYNYGAVFNNNANKLMNIVNIPISAACVGVTGDLGGLVMPETLIPKA